MPIKLAQSIRDKAALIADGSNPDELLASDIELPLDLSALVMSDVTDAGTAATKNVPASGDAASSEVVKGNDTRLTNTRTPTDASVTSAKLASDLALPGNPTTTTQSAGNNSTRLATTAFVKAAIDGVVNGAPGALDTLNEIAAALGSDPNLSATLTAAIAAKVAKAGDTMTGPLTLPGAPTNSLHAATKQYVDDNIGGGSGAAALFGSTVPASGTGSNGDIYTNVVTGAVWKKAAGAWTIQTSGLYYNPHNYLPASTALSAATTGEKTTAMQAAITAAEAAYSATSGGPGVYFMGEWEVNLDTLTITKPIEFAGFSDRVSKLKTGATSGKLLTIETSTSLSVFGTSALHRDVDKVYLHDFAVLHTDNESVSAGHTGIYVTDDTSENFFTRIERVNVSGFDTNIHFHNAVQFKVSDCLIHGHKRYGIRTTNTVTPDHGDWLIEKSEFWSFYDTGIDTSGAAIRLEGGCAGAKIQNGNKFWGSQLIGIHVYLNMAGYTLYDGMHSILLVMNNQFDGSSLSFTNAAAIVLDSAYGRSGEDGESYAGNKYFDIQISGNNVNHWRILDIRGLSGTFEDVHVQGGTTTNGGGMLISGHVNNWSLMGHSFNNHEPFTTTPVTGAPDRYLRITGTQTNGRNFGNVSKGYSVNPDLAETISADSIVAAGSLGAGKFLEATTPRQWGTPEGGGGGITPVIQDTFTDSDDVNIESHSPEIGGPWTEVQGTFKISGNKLIPDSNNNEDKAIIDAGISDYEITLDLTQYNTDSDIQSIPDIMVRYIDANNFILVDFGTAINIYVKTSGSFGSPTSSGTIDFSSTPKAATITCNGSSITVACDGEEINITETQGLTSTVLGLRIGAVADPTGTCSYDNFIVNPLA